MLCCPRSEKFGQRLAIEVGDAKQMERIMMHPTCTMPLPQKGGTTHAFHGRFASRAGGWLGAAYGVRVIAALIGAVDGSSVPGGRRLRT